MAIILIAFAVLVSIALFFFLAVRFGSKGAAEKKENTLDLDDFQNRSVKEAIRLDAEDDLIV